MGLQSFKDFAKKAKDGSIHLSVLTRVIGQDSCATASFADKRVVRLIFTRAIDHDPVHSRTLPLPHISDIDSRIPRRLPSSDGCRSPAGESFAADRRGRRAGANSHRTHGNGADRAIARPPVRDRLVSCPG
jgi:hypothetical protein